MKYSECKEKKYMFLERGHETEITEEGLMLSVMESSTDVIDTWAGEAVTEGLKEKLAQVAKIFKKEKPFPEGFNDNDVVEIKIAININRISASKLKLAIQQIDELITGFSTEKKADEKSIGSRMDLFNQIFPQSGLHDGHKVQKIKWKEVERISNELTKKNVDAIFTKIYTGPIKKLHELDKTNANNEGIKAALKACQDVQSLVLQTLAAINKAKSQRPKKIEK